MDVKKFNSGVIEEILKNAETDLFENIGIFLNQDQKTKILHLAYNKLLDALAREQESNLEQAQVIWKGLVLDFHRNQYWQSQLNNLPKPDANTQLNIHIPQALSQDSNTFSKSRPAFAFIRQLFISMVVLKAFLLYFGGYYSSYPGEGYGYGLAAVIIISITSFVYLIWKHRDLE